MMEEFKRGIQAELDNIEDSDARLVWILIIGCAIGIIIWALRS